MNPYPDAAPTILAALSAARIRRFCIDGVPKTVGFSQRSGYVLSYAVERLVHVAGRKKGQPHSNPQNVCRALELWLAAADMPCGVTWKARPDEDYEVLTFTIVPLEEKP